MPIKSRAATAPAARKAMMDQREGAFCPSKRRSKSGTLTSQAMAWPFNPPSTKHKAVKPKVRTKVRKCPAGSMDFLRRIQKGATAQHELQITMIRAPHL